MSWIEKDRLLLLETPLGADKLLLRSFTGTEAISEPFRFRLNMLSEDHNINFSSLIGQKVTFGIKMYEPGEERYFHGHVRTFVQLPGEERLATYQAEIVPWLWFLTRTADCRIFQHMTVPDIIEQVLKDFGLQDFEVQLQGSYDPWEYCVQYRETAFHFVSRLMEQEGIFYFFRHEKQKHVLVLGDSATVHKPCPGHAQVLYEREVGPGAKEHEDVVLDWRCEQDFRSGKLALTDYNFETPSTGLLASIDSQIDQGGNKRFELFDYPGEYENRDQGDKWAELRMEQEELPHARVNGASNCRGFTAGSKFELTGFERHDQNAAHVLTRVTHTAEEGAFYSGAGAGEAKYSNNFEAIPHTVRFRPPRTTEKPAVRGAQTAVVVGPSGEEIYCDKYGRVKVQFFWDRRGKKDENSSCWIRVSHPWAGKNWGAVAIPRIGQEVVVDFLEGDPDRPLITGRVYNAQQMPPYDLPTNQTQTGIKSRSSKGGASSNFNEIRMEDKKGQEELYIHAEKDKRVIVENDRTESVGRNESIGIGNNRTESVGNDETISIGNNRTESVGNDENIDIGRDRSRSVGKNESINIGENRTEAVEKNEDITIGENRTHGIGKNDQLDVGKKMLVTVGDEIVIRTGDASITMKKNGDIQIKGKNINVIGSGKIGIKASSDVNIKGSKVTNN